MNGGGIAYFFEFFDEQGAAEDLWKMLKLALIADNESADGHERNNMIFLYEHIIELLENTYALLQEKNSRVARKNNHSK